MRQRNRPTIPARYRPTGSTRNLPLKYAKRKDEPYKAAVKAPKSPLKYAKRKDEPYKASVKSPKSHEPTRMRNAVSALWRFTRKAFQATTRLVISSPLDKKIQNRIHQGNRWSDEF